MSNVLIGIIGVILFIGLALAGALILGDDFRSASNDSKAAAIQQQVKQIADAASMATLKLGSPPASQYLDASSTLIPRFLKTVPINPVRTGSTAILIDTGGAVRAGFVAKTAIMYMNGDDVSRAICESIDRQVGNTREGQAFDTSGKSFAYDSLPAQNGCMPSARMDVSDFC